MMKLSPRDEIVKARVRLQQDNPFFSYLVMSLNLIEKESIPTMGIDARGNLYYNPEFVKKLDLQQLKTVLCHEVLHVGLLHLLREGKRQHLPWNVAIDLVVNNTLVNNNFRFGDELSVAIVPDNNEFTFPNSNVTIKNIDKKIAEEIYNELNKSGTKKLLQNTYGFDKHIYIEDIDDLKGVTKEEKEKIHKEWTKRLAEASAYSKQQGKQPLGLDRYIDKLLNPKLDWKALLYRYITQEIPFDYTYQYPSKRSHVLGIYMPKVKKELIDIIVAVDTSGSIGKEELTEFLSEIVGISKAFESLRVNILFWDTQINNHYTVDNGNIEKILNYKIGGYGGTDFSEIYDYIENEMLNARLLIFFTDGYADFPKEERVKTIWTLCKNSCSDERIPYGEIVRIE